MILDDITDYIIAQTATWTLDNTFYSYMPDEPSLCLSVFEYEGGDSDYMLGGGSYALETIMLQVVVRSDSYSTARAEADALRPLLSGIGPSTISGYLRVLCEGTPHDIGPDPADRVRIATNYRAVKEPE
jgi:Bacteriophage minor capsid protein